MEVLFPTARFLQRVTLNLFADLEVVDSENIPPFGPLIIVANHQSNSDPPLLVATVPRRVRFLAKREVFTGPIVSWLLRQYGAYPLNREGADLGAYRWALDQLSRGQAVVVFPEGTRSPVGMKRALPGVAQLALKSEAPLLPVGITGTEKLGSWLRVFNPTGRLRVKFGMVFSLPSITGRPNREVLGSLTDIIMGRVAEQLPREYQGAYRIGQGPGFGVQGQGSGLGIRG